MKMTDLNIPDTPDTAAKFIIRKAQEFSADFENNSTTGGIGADGVVGIPVRTTMSKVYVRDSKWEAAEIILHYLNQNDFPLWIALFLSRKVSDESISDVLSSFQSKKTDDDPSTPDPNEPLEEEGFNTVQFTKAVTEKLITCLSNLKSDETLRKHLPPCFPFRWQYSVNAIKNTRRKMEDRHVVVPSLSLLFPNRGLEEACFCAVFDGHIGQESAAYTSTHFLHVFVEWESFESDPCAALKESFRQFDKQLCDKCDSEKMMSGCTAVVSLIMGGKLYVAWVGDSQAGLCSGNQKLTMLTTPHNPNSESEYKRVEEAGGSVMCVRGELRVNGMLNVSRSLGDALLKPVICGEPDVLEVPLTGSEYFLVLGCDGLWDVLEEGDCTETVKSFIQEHSVAEADKIAGALVQKAKANGSSDNITAVFVYLQEPKHLWSSFQ